MIRDKAERDGLVESNLGLVHLCARKFMDRGAEYDDLYQAGCVGLIKAANGFDATLGFSFSTYAVPAILGEIKRIFRDGGQVKVGRSLKEKSRRAIKEKERLTEEIGREPTINELSERLNIDAAETAFILNAAMPAFSLTGSDEESGGHLDIPVPSPEAEISDTLALREVISDLDDRDRKIIEMRYFDEKTQSVTAAALGMTQVQVSRREKIVLAEIRKKIM